MNTLENRSGKPEITTNQRNLVRTITSNPPGNIQNKPREDPTKRHQGTRLPSFLLSNIRSFGNSEETDKSTELEALLDVNNIDIACLTETWLTDTSKNQVSFDKYTHFSMVRKNAKRA